jgi:hypothetical protein
MVAMCGGRDAYGVDAIADGLMQSGGRILAPRNGRSGGFARLVAVSSSMPTTSVPPIVLAKAMISVANSSLASSPRRGF